MKHEPHAELDAAISKLKAAGLRITQPRIAILKVLLQAGRPKRIDAIHEALGSRCDLVTVYRSLGTLEEIGLVHREYQFSGTTEFSVARDQPVYSIRSRGGDRITELDSSVTASLAASVREVEEMLRARGFKHVSHVVEFFGESPAATAS
ncbi:MAG TPA: transcriptional repressor [Opitutus sp.]|nr:transcriptional repressor [Opitutus sp.]